MTGLLAPYRVLDLTDGRAELASFMFAGFGADVIKVEPPEGSTSRTMAPLVQSEAAGRAGLDSLHFHAYNRGKRSVALDLDDPSGRADFLSLVASADFVFENAGPGAMDARGLGYEALREVRPDLVYVAISPFGQTGPYAEHLTTDLTLAAMGGSMSLTGDLDRRPVRITVPQTWHHAAAESAVGAMVAHQRRLDTGEAQFVDVSVQTAVFWTGLNAMIAAAIDGSNMERTGSALRLSTLHTPLVYPCLDGEVCMMRTGKGLLLMLPWMVESGAVTQEWVDGEDWPTYERRMLDGAELVYSFEELGERVTDFTMKHTKTELFEGAIERGITCVPVNTAADTVAMEHLQVRDCWNTIALPDGITVKAPGPFVKIAGAPVEWSGPAPAVGEHTDEVLTGLEPAISKPPAAPKKSLPFEGIKVADFSWIGVGPITAKSLADNGATVVRIESDSPADRLRLVGPFTDGVFGENRCQFFGSFNTSKRSLQLDLKNATGNDVAKKLLSWCDIALDSFTAGTMDRLGLGYETARELNPEIIMATTCLFGQYGPAANVAGYGYHAAAISGFYEMTGWDDRPPGGPWNAYTDTIAPRFLTTTLMAALDHRRRTGEGLYIDQAQMESSLHFQSPQLLDVQRTGISARRNGNTDPTMFPHDAYRCEGDDQWCAIAIAPDGREADEQWAGLCGLIGQPGWVEDEAMSKAEGRRAHHGEIDVAITAFTQNLDPHEAMARLQEAGVPAGAVQRSSDHLVDPQLAHRNFFRPMVHPEMGNVPYEGHQYRIAGYDSGPRSPAPCLGEHTFEVLTEVLGLDVEEAADILASGACG